MNDPTTIATLALGLTAWALFLALRNCRRLVAAESDLIARAARLDQDLRKIRVRVETIEYLANRAQVARTIARSQARAAAETEGK